MLKEVFLLTLAVSGATFAGTPASFQTRYIPLGTQDESVAIAADASGNVFVVSEIGRYADIVFSALSVRVTKIGPSGNLLASYAFGQGIMAYGAATDPQGNLVVVGAPAGSVSGGFIAKLDSGLTRVLALNTGLGTNGMTQVTRVAISPTGNVYVAGNTSANDLPANQGPNHGGPIGFLSVLSGDLSTVIHSMYLWGRDGNPPPCTFFLGFSGVQAIALDPTGAVVIGGQAAYIPPPYTTGYTVDLAAKMSSDLSSINACLGLPVNRSNEYVGGLAVDSRGNIILGGSGQSYGASLNGPIQPQAPGINNGFVVKFDPTLQNLLWGTYFGGLYGGPNSADRAGIFNACICGVVTDAEDNVWITGISEAAELPGATTTSEEFTPFIAGISSDGSQILSLIPSQFGGRGIARSPDGKIAALGPSDAFVVQGDASQPSLLLVASSANNNSTGTIAPIELLSLYGAGIGPPSAVGGVVSDGAFTNTLSGYQVLFNGTPAPILYAGPNQMNVVSPAAIAGQQTAQITVTGPQGTTQFPTVYVADARPQIFAQPGSRTQFLGRPYYEAPAIALNPDGSLNSSTNPMPRSGVFTVWATGTGLLSVSQPDGTVTSSASNATTLVPVSGSFPSGGFAQGPFEATYVGQAPGAVLGLTQMNVPIPTFLGGAMLIQQGDAQSDLVNVYWAGEPGLSVRDARKERK